jgi:hypothetical protein
MRNLQRNVTPVFFKTYEGQREIVDQYGNATGSYVPIYSELKSALLCVSPNKGSSEVEQFGTLLDYDRTMTTSDVNCEIAEDSVLWLDGADTSGAYNAVVKRKSPWKNTISYAIQNVTISQYQARQAVTQSADDQV